LAKILETVCSREFLEDLCLQIPGSASRERKIIEDLVQFVRGADNWASLQGLRSQLESIVLSEFGELVSAGDVGIDLFRAVNDAKIVFIFLDTRRYGETARDLQGCPVVVAHQELCDLKRISPEFAGRLIGNTSTLYAFLQKRPESAEVIASIAGTRRVKESTEQVDRFWLFERSTGMKSVKEVEEFIIHPNIIKSQRVGKCVCIKKYPKAKAYQVSVLSYVGE
jgi:hypothetical protein